MLILRSTQVGRPNIEHWLAEESVEYEVFSSKAFSGQDVITFMIDISKVAIPTLAYFLLSMYKAKHLISLKIGDKEVKGSIENIKQLETLLKEGSVKKEKEQGKS